MSVPRTVAALRSTLAPPRGLGAGSRSADGRSYAFTSLTPIRAGSEDHLAAHLEGLAEGRDSPLARLTYVHFGRWLIIDHLKMNWARAPRHPTRLQSKYLLFTASVTAPDTGSYARDLPGSFLRELAVKIPDEADAVWGHCMGYPGSAAVDELVNYLTGSQLDTVLFFVGYPSVTVEQVNRALTAGNGLVNFVRGHQDPGDPAQLQQDYLEESATWCL